ncbi:hypothetical protein D3C71_1473300 [compost metagenome]
MASTRAADRAACAHIPLRCTGGDCFELFLIAARDHGDADGQHALPVGCRGWRCCVVRVHGARARRVLAIHRLQIDDLRKHRLRRRIDTAGGVRRDDHVVAGIDAVGVERHAPEVEEVAVSRIAVIGKDAAAIPLVGPARGVGNARVAQGGVRRTCRVVVRDAEQRAPVGRVPEARFGNGDHQVVHRDAQRRLDDKKVVGLRVIAGDGNGG